MTLCEIQVLQGMMAGRGMKSIAAATGTSLRAMKVHRLSLDRKLASRLPSPRTPEPSDDKFEPHTIVARAWEIIEQARSGEGPHWWWKPRRFRINSVCGSTTLHSAARCPHPPVGNTMNAAPNTVSPSPTFEIPPDAESVPGVPIEAVLCSDELKRRPARPRDSVRQQEHIKTLLYGLTSAADTVLQSLVDTILHALPCDSGGISLISPDRSRFYWPAIAGVLAPHVQSGTPLDFGPCGDVLQANRPLLMRRPQLRYRYLLAVPPIKEVLLVPFYGGEGLTGTVWAVMHEPPHDVRSSQRPAAEFDSEDLRVLRMLAGLATAAHQVWSEHRSPPPSMK